MKSRHIWVVEMFLCGWEPTVGVGLDRAGAQQEMKKWKEKNLDDRFRICKYRRMCSPKRRKP